MGFWFSAESRASGTPLFSSMAGSTADNGIGVGRVGLPTSMVNAGTPSSILTQSEYPPTLFSVRMGVYVLMLDIMFAMARSRDSSSVDRVSKP